MKLTFLIVSPLLFCVMGYLIQELAIIKEPAFWSAYGYLFGFVTALFLEHKSRR